jgi:uncharacterized protein (TIGR03435 family)
MIPRIFAFTLLSCSIALGQSPTASPAFEVASVRPHPGPLHVEMGFSSSGPRLNLEGYNPMQLVMEAYGLKDYQVSAAPSLKTQDTIYYDIAAKAEGDATPTKAEFRRMLQILLAQRFNLKYHFEAREMPVYALVVEKSGPKFKPSAPDASGRGEVGVNGRNQTLTTPLESMNSLADDIANAFSVDRPVVDRTGLTGTYDIQLEATPEFRINRDSGSEDVSIFTAVQEQLGLKLEPAKAPVQVLIIDHIESPTSN